MRIAVCRYDAGDHVVVDQDGRFRRTRFADLRELVAAGVLDDPSRLEYAGPGGSPAVDVTEPDPATLRPPATAHAKVLCVGHNYRAHILEMGKPLPEHPTVFTKFAESLVGPRDDIGLEDAAEAWDWEAELAVVVGRVTRHVSVERAADHVAGYTVANDVSARDWQRRSSQWLLGKTFPSTTPLGPWIVTPDAVDPSAGLTITCRVDGVEKQRASTGDLLFGAAALISYVSQVVTLGPGDVVLTGTPGGVGIARDPAERLVPGQVLTTEIESIGRLENRCVRAESRAPSHAPSHG